GTGDQGQDQQGDTGSNEQPGDTGDQGQDQQGDTGSNDHPGDTAAQGDGQGGEHDPSDDARHGGGTEDATAPAGAAGNPALPDTSTTPAAVLSPLFAALGLLMVIGAHPFIRRTALADRA